MKPNTQKGRILAILADGGWHGLRDFGHDGYTARNRIGELRRDFGYEIESRKAHGHRWHEYRLQEGPQICL